MLIGVTAGKSYGAAGEYWPGTVETPAQGAGLEGPAAFCTGWMGPARSGIKRTGLFPETDLHGETVVSHHRGDAARACSGGILGRAAALMRQPALQLIGLGRGTTHGTSHDRHLTNFGSPSGARGV